MKDEKKISEIDHIDVLVLSHWTLLWFVLVLLHHKQPVVVLLAPHRSSSEKETVSERDLREVDYYELPMCYSTYIGQIDLFCFVPHVGSTILCHNPYTAQFVPTCIF